MRPLMARVRAPERVNAYPRRMYLNASAYFSPWLSFGLYVLVAVIWLVPDRRMEHYIDAHMESRP